MVTGQSCWLNLPCLKLMKAEALDSWLQMPWIITWLKAGSTDQIRIWIQHCHLNSTKVHRSVSQPYTTQLVRGWSSGILVQRRAIREYVVESEGSGFYCQWVSNHSFGQFWYGKSHVYQVLILRGVVPHLKSFSSIVSCINWFALLFQLWLILLKEAVANGFYAIHSKATSKPSVAVIIDSH